RTGSALHPSPPQGRGLTSFGQQPLFSPKLFLARNHSAPAPRDTFTRASIPAFLRIARRWYCLDSGCAVGRRTVARGRSAPVPERPSRSRSRSTCHLDRSRLGASSGLP